MYGIARLIIGIILLIISFTIIKKSKILKKKKWIIISIVLAFVTSSVLCAVPIENLFISFPSPEKSFDYVNPGKTKVELVVKGQHTDCVVARKDNVTFVTSIIPKSKEGWKLGVGFDTKIVKKLFDNGVSIQIYRYKNTDEYYVYVLDTNGGICEISDSCASEYFSVTTKNKATQNTYYHFYAYINDYDDYSITINGHEFEF